MSVESAPPANARLVYGLVIGLGVLAALTALIVLLVIILNYTSREELRNPVPLTETQEPAYAALPEWVVRS